MLRLTKPLVDVHWLNDHLGNSDLIVLDASIKTVTDPNAEPVSEIMIPGSRFFDLKEQFSDTKAPFPNTLPSEDQFQKEARRLGINNDSAIVVYDDKGIYSSPRAWYMFKVFGHNNVAVLDGGLKRWLQAGYNTEQKRQKDWLEGDFDAKMNPEMIKFHADIKQMVASNSSLILDARSKGRFYATEPEPRIGLRGGHIPNSESLPFSDLLEDNQMKSVTELKNIFLNFESQNKPLTFSCGSGITACVLALGAELSGLNDYAVYDGSWTEWGSLEP